MNKKTKIALWIGIPIGLLGGTLLAMKYIKKIPSRLKFKITDVDYPNKEVNWELTRNGNHWMSGGTKLREDLIGKDNNYENPSSSDGKNKFFIEHKHDGLVFTGRSGDDKRMFQTTVDFQNKTISNL